MNVTCRLDPDNNRVFIHDANGHTLGWVNDEGVLELFGNVLSGMATISLDDLEIVLDNYNQLKELRRTSGDEIEAKRNAVADKASTTGSKYPGMSYEEGIRDALEWVLGEYEGDPYTPEMKRLRFWYYYTLVMVYLNIICVSYEAVLRDWVFMGGFLGLAVTFWWLNGRFTRSLMTLITMQYFNEMPIEKDTKRGKSAILS